MKIVQSQTHQQVSPDSIDLAPFADIPIEQILGSGSIQASLSRPDIDIRQLSIDYQQDLQHTNELLARIQRIRTKNKRIGKLLELAESELLKEVGR